MYDKVSINMLHVNIISYCVTITISKSDIHNTFIHVDSL